MVSVWIPIIVAVVALVGPVLTAVLARKTSTTELRTDELSKTVAGMSDLLEQTRIQLEQERRYCERRIGRLERRLTIVEETLPGMELEKLERLWNADAPGR